MTARLVISDHGQLNAASLLDDDHTQYALADKSRPSPWVAAGDLSALSLADLGTKDHADLDLLGADDHTQYLLLAGRAGGQDAIGGTGASEELSLRGTTNANLGLIRCKSPVVFDDVTPASALVPYSVEDSSIQTITGNYIGGTFSDQKTVTFSGATFIYEVLGGRPTIITGVVPGFAAFTLFNGLPTLRGGALSTHTPLSALVLNAGPVLENPTVLVAMTTVNSIGMNWAPQTRAAALFATMSVTNQTAINVSPVFSTIANSFANLGTITGVKCNQPAAALFQPASGTHAMTAYYGLDFVAMTFGGNVPKVVVRSALAAASNAYFLQNNGGAQSDFGSSTVYGTGWRQIRTDNVGFSVGAANDVSMYWDGAAFIFDPIATNHDDLEWTFADGSHILASSDFGGTSELRMGFDRFAFGQTGAVGNQVGVFVAPARATGVNGGWSDFLLTQAGNLTIDHTMSEVYAWTVNAISLTAGTGSITGEVATFVVGGMTTSGLGSAETSALRVTGRTHLRGSLGLVETTPAQLTGNVNDYQGHGTGNSQRAAVRVSSDASRNVTGWDKALSRDNDTIWVANVGSFNVVLQHQNAGSLAANSMISPTGADLTLGPDESALLWYDATDTRWRILYHTGT